MKRLRLRPLPNLDQIYVGTYDHTRWQDHIVRVGMTVEFSKWFAMRHDVTSVADLSCGDAAIVNALQRDGYVATVYRGDYTFGHQFTGRIEDTIEQIPNVDLFICSETIEHVDDPDALLQKIRAKARYLVLTTPDSEFNDGNPEHVWGWDQEAMRQMLTDAGFTPDLSTTLVFLNGYYTFQFWGCF